MKILGVIIIVCITTYIGFNKSWLLGKRIECLADMQKFISFFKTEIRYNLETSKEILKKFSEQTENLFITLCARYIKGQDSFESAWEKSVNDETSALTKTDKSIIKEFGRGIGTTDLEGQLAHCDLYLEYIKQQYEQAVEEKKKKGKLYVLIGNAVGLLIAIVII